MGGIAPPFLLDQPQLYDQLLPQPGPHLSAEPSPPIDAFIQEFELAPFLRRLYQRPRCLPSVPRNYTKPQKLFDYHGNMAIPLKDNIFAQQIQEFGVIFGFGQPLQNGLDGFKPTAQSTNHAPHGPEASLGLRVQH